MHRMVTKVRGQVSAQVPRLAQACKRVPVSAQASAQARMAAGSTLEANSRTFADPQ